MLKRQVAAAPPNVLLIDDDDVHVNVTRRGERSLDQPCQLTIAINGEEPLSFLEDAGNAAPKAAIVNLAAPEGIATALRDALRTKPWQHSDTPIISYSLLADLNAGETDLPMMGYLVKNRPVSDLIDTIRDALDLNTLPN
ncbi:MAG: hypothetical protein AAF557_21140 [Pseudomonadota bacterium]